MISKIFIDYIQEKPFWRIFLYAKNKDFIDHQLAVFYQRMELLDAHRSECNDEEYINSVNTITEERRRTESAIYVMLTSQFFGFPLKHNVSQIGISGSERFSLVCENDYKCNERREK